MNGIAVEHGIHRIVAVMRLIVKNFSDNEAGKKIMWAFIQDFLAEQAGLEKVEFEGLRVNESSGSREPSARKADELKGLRVRLSTTTNLKFARGAFGRALGKLITSIDPLFDEAVKAVKELRQNLEQKRGKEHVLNAQRQKLLNGSLRNYERKKGEIDNEGAELLASMRKVIPEIVRIPGKFANALKKKMRALELECGEELVELKDIEKELENLEVEIEDLEEVLERMEDEKLNAGAIKKTLTKLEE